MNETTKTLSKVFLALIFFAFLPIKLHAQIELESCEFLHVRDFEIVEEFLNSKRTIDWKEKNEYLKISGDIKAQALRRIEKQAGVYIRGHNAAAPANTYEAILNLRFDYKCGRSWMAGYLQFDNDMGACLRPPEICKRDPEACTGSGFCDDICLKRAYAGYNFIDCDGLIFETEIGRRPMYTIFDSRIEFHARFDGIRTNLSKVVKDWGKYFIHGGPFVVDYRVNHFAYIVETGVYDFYNTLIDIKYSFIDWVKHGKNRCGVRNAKGWRFKNSQLSVAYNIPPKYVPAVCKKARLYGAFLYNHNAPRILVTNFHKENDAWYAGMIIGEVRKKNDWSLDINYQFVRAQAIPECDMHGIGRGAVFEPFVKTGHGKGNFKGWHFEFLYALTNKMSLDFLYEFSNEINKNIVDSDPKIGGSVLYHRYEFDIIQAF